MKKTVAVCLLLGIFALAACGCTHGTDQNNGNGTNDAGLTSPPAIAQTPSASPSDTPDIAGTTSPSMPLVPTDSPDASASPGTSAAASPSPSAGSSQAAE